MAAGLYDLPDQFRIWRWQQGTGVQRQGRGVRGGGPHHGPARAATLREAIRAGLLDRLGNPDDPLWIGDGQEGWPKRSRLDHAELPAGGLLQGVHPCLL